MKLKLFIFIVVIIFSGCSSQSVSLIGSRFVSNNSTYKAYLLTNGLIKNSQVRVAFGPKGVQPSIIENIDQNSFKELNFNVASENFDDYELKISSNLQGICKEQFVNLVKTSEVPIVFIQFNKPIYNVNENFTFKIFILSQKLLPVTKVRQMDITIVNPRRVVWNHLKISDVSKYGVYENSIQIYDNKNFGYEDLGIWTINVEVDGKKVSKSFEVQYVNKDETEVFVQVPSVVAFADRKIYLNIFTKYQKGRFAAIYLKAKFVNSSKVEIDKHVKSEYLKDQKTVIMLDFQQDFGILFPTRDMILTLTVVLVQGQKTTTVTKDAIMKYKDRHTIQVVRKKYFKPGFKFPIKIRVKRLDGTPDNSFNQLTTTVKYLSNKKQDIEEKSFETNLKNGDAVYGLQPKAKTTKIILKMKFADTEYTEEVERFPGVDEYMQVSMLNKSSKVGSKVQIKVQSTEDMELPRLLIFGTKGIIHSEQFDDAVGKDVFDFPLELTNEMRPEARGLVFYTRKSDGAIIYDEFSLNIGLSIDNSLEITAPEKAQPNQFVNIEVKTEKDSLVYLVAIDAISELFNGDNEISRTSVYDEIAYYINRKFTNPSNYQFEKLNGFVLEPLETGSDCNSRQKYNKDIEESLENSTTHKTSQKYFPKILFEDNFIATTEVYRKQIKIPDSTTKWRIYGISVHPTKGFTVSKTIPEISIKGTGKN